MKNIMGEKSVGDSKSLPLMASERGLRAGVEQTSQIQADASKPAVQCSVQSEFFERKGSNAEAKKAFTCRQTLWFSFFFDGTGNNLDADEDFLKHSNVAKLYRAREKENKKNGFIRFIFQEWVPIFLPLGMMEGVPLAWFPVPRARYESTSR